MKPAIEIKKISKRFFIGGSDEKYLTLRDAVGAMFSRRRRNNTEFWALKDVAFDVPRGESLAIIGRNGAGKTTLLKLLSRIMIPTSGSITVRGKVASLLEVGTGFHQELSGRENVFLNGAIMGLSRRETREKFDRIVEFAGVGKFIDTPLKRYSSGMQVRLAFSVAAHLEPDILIVDEVLAVGDAAYQRKCLHAMENSVRNGRTVLFVSHNMDAVRNLCRNAVILEDGRIYDRGGSTAMVSRYLDLVRGPAGLPGDGMVSLQERSAAGMFRRAEILRNDSPAAEVTMGSDVKLRITVRCPEQIPTLVLGVALRDRADRTVLGVNNLNYGCDLAIIQPGKDAVITVHIPFLQLMAGEYSVDLYLTDSFRDIDTVLNAFTLQVTEAPAEAGTLHFPIRNVNVFFHRDMSWTMEHCD